MSDKIMVMHIIGRLKQGLLYGAASMALALVASVVLGAGVGQAATNGRMIDDAVFDASSSMSTQDIQNFLNQFPNSCLKNYTDDMPSSNPAQAYFSYSGTGSVAQIIRRVADNYGINPRVLLAKLEQEQGLVSGGGGCQLWRQASAIGFNCKDGTQLRQNVLFRGTSITTCVGTDADMGVARQLSRGGWLLKMAKERANGNLNWMVPDDASWVYSGPMTQGNRKRCGSCSTIYYDGYWNGVYLESGATAALYFYTPYLNQAFDDIWESWWGAGSTIGVPYQWQYAGQSSSTGGTILATQKATWTVYAKNTGNTAWVNTGPNPMRLGTSRSYDRSSTFCDSTWLSCNRAATLNENTVQPGQTGSFTFTVQAPAVGQYNEYFQPVVEGKAWLNDVGLYFGMNVTAPNLTGTVLGNTLPTTLTAGATGSGTLSVRNDGNAIWYKTGRFPLNIGSSNPNDRMSPFYVSTWLGQTRLANMNEASVAPGQAATFTIPLKGAPYNKTYTETYSLVIDGYSWFSQQINHNVTITGGQTPPVNTLSANQGLTVNQALRSADGRFALVMQSDGNLVLYSPNRALWFTGTTGRPATSAIVQSDGNFVLYGSGIPYWATWTQASGGATLILQDDGNLVLYTSQGRPIWNSRTGGQI